MKTLKVKSLRVAAVQTNTTPDWRKNLKKSMRWIDSATKKKTELICFPENFLMISEKNSEMANFAQSHVHECLKELQSIAKQNRVTILAGSVAIQNPGQKKMDNQSILISKTGKIIARYSKMHLFDVNLIGDRNYRESDRYRSGKKVVTKMLSFGRLGMSICYDIRFPELYRTMARKHTQIITIPSAFTVPTGRLHWDVLTRARAIENQAFVIAPAQVGQNTETRKTWGHTRIIDPLGAVLAEKKRGEGLVIADLKQSVQRRFRTTFPALKHRLLKRV